MINKNEISYNVNCKFCNKNVVIKLTSEQYKNLGRYNRGEGHIQDLLPELSADDREMFVSGMCPECWDKTFSGEEDGEECDYEW